MEQNEGQMTESVLESTTSNLAEHPVTVEKQVPQSVVNRVVAEAKQSAYEQGRKAVLTTSLPTERSTLPTSTITPEQVEQLIEERINKKNSELHEQQMQQAAQEFLVKLKPGETKYSDFSDAINSVNWNAIPHVLDLANQTDNTEDVVYELAKNPQKAIKLWQLSQVNPQAALAETQKLAESIKQNQLQPATTRPPLSPLSPSITSMASGSPSLRDKKENPNFIY